VWVVDAGRLSTRSSALPLATAADHVLLVTAGSFPALQLVPHRVDSVRAAGCPVSVVVVEPTAWPIAEIADFVGADVAALLPVGRGRSADVSAMSGSGWRGWWRQVAELTSYLAATAPAVEVGT
jgi:hypothetical protein